MLSGGDDVVGERKENGRETMSKCEQHYESILTSTTTPYTHTHFGISVCKHK